MMDFEETAFLAAAPRTDEGALTLIAFPDFSLHHRGHMTTRNARYRWLSLLSDLRKLSMLELPQQYCQRTTEDNADISIRHDVSHCTRRSVPCV